MKMCKHSLIQIIEDTLGGNSVGLVSVCSSHPMVVKAAIQQCKVHNSLLLIESTSNQVDQFGGYSGMTPKKFQSYIMELATREKFDLSHVILGGDHLGPNRWKTLPAIKAMSFAHDQIAAYVEAGYQKIHIDASMALADDHHQGYPSVSEEMVAERTAQLCKTAEQVYSNLKECISTAPLYVIGTEVPVPGGEIQDTTNTIVATTPEQALNTIELTRKAFYRLHLEEAWERVIGLVVQPGVDFGNDWVYSPQVEPIQMLSRALVSSGHHLAYEAHSTDYQRENSLRLLVDNHFAFLKVGPALSFALRETLYALENIEKNIYHNARGVILSKLQATMEQIMNEDPKYWETYCGNSQLQYSLKHFGLSDRTRYYLYHQSLISSVNVLFRNLKNQHIPIGLLRQFLPSLSEKIEGGVVGFNNPETIVHEAIGQVLAVYYRATKSSAEYQQ